MNKYFYACWSCVNTKSVIHTLNILRENKYLFYYDEGYKNIDKEDIDKIVKDSHFILMFIDKDYLKRKNIIDCIDSAVNHEKDIIVINIDSEEVMFKYNYKYMFNDSNCYSLYSEFSKIDLFNDVKYYLSMDSFKKDEIYNNDFYKIDLTDSKELYFKGLDYYNDRNVDEALFYLNKAKKLNNSSAVNLLSSCNSNCYFNKTDYDKAYELKKLASNLGSVDAKMEYARSLTRYYSKEVDYYKGLDLYKDLAMNGKVEAYSIIGESYEKGIFTVIDYYEAYKWYKRGALLGCKNAMFNLAKCYLYGKGVFKDEDDGMKWLKKSAHSGNMEASLYLAEEYDTNIKYKNDFLAFHYCLMAALSGNDEAEYRLSGYYSQGKGVEKDEFKAREWMWNAACDGHKWARYETDYPGGTEEMINKRYYEYVFEKK